MTVPRDPWLQELIDQYRVESAKSAAFFQYMIQEAAAQQLLVTVPPRRRSHRWFLHGRVLRFMCGSISRRRRRTVPQQVEVMSDDGSLAPTEAGVNDPSVIIIDARHVQKGT